MRVVTVIVLAMTVVTALLLRCSDGANLRGFAIPEDDDEYRPRPLYKDYSLIRGRVARADDSFDDYGHLRFGRSDD
uniref:Sulfakinin n=1 Tax=Galleria mellonella TaxID=7137 RepID=A0A6J3BYV2_GALME|nr:sulfakinin [Galleria mellonella]